MTKARATSFKKVVVCHTNDFKPGVNDKIKTWVQANGGTFQKDLTSDVTHLITSKPAWKRCYSIVKKARKMKTVFIVKFDWLEDSLMKKPVRALPVKQYLWDHAKFDLVAWVTKNRKQTKTVSPAGDSTSTCDKKIVPRAKQVQLTGASFDQAKKDFERDMGTAGFHPYSDSTGFVYIISLLREDIVRDCFEHYKIKLFESDSIPHTYACYVQYTRPKLKTATVTLAPPGSTWAFTWAMFEKRYRAQVGKPWGERPGCGVDINLDGEDEHWHYQTPDVGEPEGLRGKMVDGEDDMAGTRGETANKKNNATRLSIESAKIEQDAADFETGTHKAHCLGVKVTTPDPDDSHLP